MILNRDRFSWWSETERDSRKKKKSSKMITNNQRFRQIKISVYKWIFHKEVDKSHVSSIGKWGHQDHTCLLFFLMKRCKKTCKQKQTNKRKISAQKHSQTRTKIREQKIAEEAAFCTRKNFFKGIKIVCLCLVLFVLFALFVRVESFRKKTGL